MGKKIKTWPITDVVVMTLRAMKEQSRSSVTEEQRSIRAYFTFRPFRRKWSFAQKDSFRRCPLIRVMLIKGFGYFFK